MKPLINILFLEDNPSDVLIIEQKLKEAEFNYSLKTVNNKEDFALQLDLFRPNIVLFALKLQKINLKNLLTFTVKHSATLPFILIAQDIEEKKAIEYIKQGAWDYVLKSNLNRLAIAIFNSLKLREEKLKNIKNLEKLAATEAVKLDLRNSIPYMLLYLDIKNYKIIDCNQKLLNELAYNRNELIGKSVFKLLASAELKQIDEKQETTFVKSTEKKEIEIKRKNGETMIVSSSSSLIKNSNEESIYIRLIWINAHKDQKIKKELFKSQKLLREARQIAHLGNWEYDLINNRLKGSNETYRIFNIDKHKGVHTFDFFLKSVYPQDVEIITKAVSLAIHKNQPIDIEYRILHKNGKIRFIHSKGKAQFDKNGKAVSLSGVVQDITEQKKIEEKYIRTAQILNMSSSVVFLWKNERNWPIKHVSPNVSRIFGYTDKEFLSNTIRFMDIVHPDDAKRVFNELNKARKNIETSIFEHKPYRIISKDDRIVWVKDQTEIIRDNRGNIVYYQGVIHDISNEILANLKLKEEKKKYEGLSKIYQVQNQQLKKALMTIEQSEERYRNILNANFDAVIITSEDSRIEYMNPAAKKMFHIDKVIGLCHKVLFNKNERCEWCEFYNIKKKKYAYKEIKNPNDGQIYMVSFSKISGNNGSTSVMSVYRNVTDFRKAEHERLKLLDALEASLNEIFIFDFKTLKFNYVNQGGINHLGYSLEEFKNMTPLDVAPELNAASLNNILAPLANGKQKKVIIETVHKRRNGSLYPIEVHLQLISQNNKKYYLAVINDITERVKSQETIKKLYTAISQSPISVIITDTNGRIEYVNPEFTTVSGYSIKEVIGKNPNILKSNLHKQDFYKNLWESISKGKVWRGEFINKKKDNTYYWVNSIVGAVKNEEGKIINYISLQQDITEQKQLSEKLKIQTEQLERVFNNVQDVIYSIEIERNSKNKKVVQISPSCKDVLGYSQEEFYKNPDLITDIIHPEDKKIVFFSKQKFINDKTLNLKHRIINAKGETRWVNNKITPHVSNDEQIIRLDASMSDITNSQLLQNSLKQTLDFNKRIINTSGIGILMFDKEGNCLSVNNNAAKIAGYTVEEMLNRKFTDHLPFKEAGLVEDARKCLKTQLEIRKNAYLKNRKKKQFWIDIQFSTYSADDKVNLLVLIKDISKIKFAEIEVQQKAMELRNLVQTVKTPIFGLDTNGRINGWNRAAHKLSGYSKKEVVNKEFAEILFPEYERKEVRALIVEAVLGYTVPEKELKIKTKSGELIKMLLNINTLRNMEGNVVGVICAGQDITKMANYRNKLEKQVKKRTKKLKQALKKEKELGILKSRFVSMASHEFRTPLAAINFAAGFIKKYWKRMDEETRKSKLLKIEDQVKHMTQLLDDVLTIGRINEGRISFNPLVHNFKEFINNIVEEVKFGSNNSHEIRVINNSKVEHIYIDEKLGRNIFINLLSNAIKFSPGKKFIELICSSDDHFLHFEIKDYGIGIKREELEHIFEPFRRGSNTDTISGTGLGLAIVKEAVKKHSGTIHVESEPEKGTTFKISLPFQKTNELNNNYATGTD